MIYFNFRYIRIYMTQRFLAVCLLLIMATTVATKAIVAKNVVVAINCGTKDESVESYDKIFKYQPDEKYISGKSVPVDYYSNDAAKDADILYTFDKKLYMYERHTYDEMTYSLPVRNGKNTLILKFAEMYFTKEGQRVFNIKIGSKIVRKDFDVIKNAGQKYAAHEEYIEIDVQGDGVYFQGVKIPNGLSNNKIKLSFVRGKADNPIVQGIIVYHESIENSPKSEFQTTKSTWDKQKELQKAMKEDEKLKEKVSIQKKKEKIVMRNDQIIVQNEQVTKSSGPREKFGIVRKLLMGPVGILGWSVSFAAGFFFLYKHVFLMDSNKSEAVSE